jgi:hypothetical protein
VAYSTSFQVTAGTLTGAAAAVAIDGNPASRNLVKIINESDTEVIQWSHNSALNGTTTKGSRLAPGKETDWIPIATGARVYAISPTNNADYSVVEGIQ